jgi:hypothetical protein
MEVDLYEDVNEGKLTPAERYRRSEIRRKAYMEQPQLQKFTESKRWLMWLEHDGAVCIKVGGRVYSKRHFSEAMAEELIESRRKQEEGK